VIEITALRSDFRRGKNMGSQSPTYAVGVIGFSRYERRVLRGVLGISEQRNPTFRPFEPQADACPHLVIVNADGPGALDSWNRFRRANAHRARFAPVFVSRNPEESPSPDPYVLHRPMAASELFAVLDQAVTEVHDYRPPDAPEPVDALVTLTPEDSTITGVHTTLVDMEIKHLTRHPAPQEHGSARPASTAVRALARPTTAVTALVIDGSLPARVQMRSALKTIAFLVDFADNGAQALEKVEKNRYSIVFLGASLPDQDAYELCQRLRGHPMQQRTPVVMMIGHATPAEREKCKLAGCDAYLEKPIRAAAFEQLVWQLVWEQGPSSEDATLRGHI
jgi:CheY-like chemotaxis protein